MDPPDAAPGPDAPLVSVVIPARDAAATLRRAIASVAAQDYAPIEIIVVDDASRDGSAALAGEFAGVRVIRLSAPQGAAAARNAGIEAARGEIIAFQDADDEWLPGKLRRQVDLLRRDPETVFTACGARLSGPEGDRGPLYDGQIPQDGAGTWRGLLARNTIATPCVVAWRRALLAVGGFDAALKVAEDQDLWIRLSLYGGFAYLDAHLVRVHVAPTSVSGVGTAQSPRRQIAVTLPMIRRHLAQQRGRLSRREVRRIMGERLCRVGRTAYTYGLYAEGLSLVLQATLLGYEPGRNLLFLAAAAPPARWLKRMLRR